MARILYVETDLKRAQKVCALFEQRGHTVHLACSAERAMLRVQRGMAFDVLALELILHGMDGAEFCRWIENKSPLKGIRKVAFTAPGCQLSFHFERGLPRWLPVNRFIAELDDPSILIEAVEKL